MDYPEFIFCKWNGRFWPARVLPTFIQQVSKDHELDVEIFEVREQASVQLNNTRPFLMVELEKLSNDLDRSKKLIVTVEELNYRAALRTAMDLLKDVSTTVPENIKVLPDYKNLHTPELRKVEVKKVGIRESPRQIQEKGSKSAAVDEDKSTLKSKKCLTAKPSTCREDFRIKPEPSGKLKTVECKKHTVDDKNRKRTEDLGEEKDSPTCKKRVTSKRVFHSSISAEEHLSEKSTDTYRSEKSKGIRKTLKGSLFTEREKCQVMSSDEENDHAGKDKTSENDKLSCEQRNESKMVCNSSTSKDKYKSVKSKGAKSSFKSLATENKGLNVLSADTVKGDTRKAIISRQDVLLHKQTSEVGAVSSPSTSTDPQRSGKNKDARNKCKKSLAVENEKLKAKQCDRPWKSGPKEQGSVQADAMVLQGEPMDWEDDVQTKGKFNQLSLPDFSFGEEIAFLSSDLSVGCSSPECNIMQELWTNDDTEEDIQLPVVNFQREPPSFKQADFVWCKFRRYPYWPSLVKSVRSKEKKATIIFVEECLSDPNAKKQSFQVAFYSLKHYDCPEKQELLGIARKDYGKSVDWCDALISDYRIRLGCDSFSGSFLEYCTEAISYPVRRECSNMKLDFPSVNTYISESLPHVPDTEPRVNKVLPDRSRASRDKANEKLVECIVKNQQVETHLINILKGKSSSQWLKKFQSSNRGVDCLETYLEDEEQLELVVNYLYTLCEKMHNVAKELMNGDQVKFILEVLLPEAVIFAIASTNNISYDKAKKKFLEGPYFSKRERTLFEKQLLEKKAAKLRENRFS